MNRSRIYVFVCIIIIPIFLCFPTVINAQGGLENLQALFPTSVKAFKTYQQPEIVKMKVNGADYYHLVQQYSVNLDTSFTVRLNDYSKEPDYIDRMLSEFENAESYEDTSEKWSDLEILGYPTRLQVVKKYPTYNFTTLVKEKSWLVTFSGSGIDENEAEEYMTIFLAALTDE